MTTSYLSISEFPGDGVTTEWEFNFAGGYISREHVLAYTSSPVGVITPVDITSAFISDFKIEVTPPVPIGDTLRIYRDTPREEPIVNFTGGSNFTEANLDLLARQTIFAVAEAFDAGAYAAVNDLLGAAGSALEAAVTAQAATALSESNALASALSAAASLAAAIIAKDTAVAAASEPGVAAVLANLTAVQNAAANAATATAKAGEAGASAAAASASAVSANGSAVTATAQAVIATFRAAESANSALISAANNAAARAQNSIINGRMWQAPDAVTSWTNPATATYMLGLWRADRAGTFAYNAARVATGNTACPYALQFTCTAAQAAIGANDVLISEQILEATTCEQHIGETFTVRGRVYSDVAGVVPVYIRNVVPTHSYVIPVTAVAGVFTEFEHTVIGGLPSAGTWTSASGAGLRFGVCLAGGSTYQAPSSGTWNSGNYFALAGQVNAVGAVSRKVALTKISMTPGTAKPALEDFGIDAFRLARFYRPGLACYFIGYQINGTTVAHTIQMPEMARVPSATITYSSNANCTATTVNSISAKHFSVAASMTSSNYYIMNSTVVLDARY